MESPMELKIESDCFNEVEMIEKHLESSYEEGEIESNSDSDHEMGNLKQHSTISGLFSSRLNSSLQWEKQAGENQDLHRDNDEMKKLNRAKRFGIEIREELNRTREPYSEELIELHRDLGINEENERHYRFNAIHMRNAQNMSTEDVLDYFEMYSPLNIEWVNDVSCNIVWRDDVSAARALLGVSKKLKNLDKIHFTANDSFKEKQSKSEKNFENRTEDGIDAREINMAIPPGFWRIGKADKKNQLPLLRYATKSDKKQTNDEKNGEYHINYGNCRGLDTPFYRNEIKQARHNNLWGGSYDQTLQFNVKNNPWSELAFEWGKTEKIEKVNPSHFVVNKNRSSPLLQTNISDLRLSLKSKKAKRKHFLSLYHEDEENEKYYNSDEEVKSKFPRMTMYADEEEKKLMKKKHFFKPIKDLRSKINRERSDLRIERFKSSEEQNSEENSNSDNEYENESSGAWALENYHDLRESLGRNKRYNHRLTNTQKYDSQEVESEEDEFNEDDFYLTNMRQRSPLQIEIENDEYYERRSNKT